MVIRYGYIRYGREVIFDEDCNFRHVFWDEIPADACAIHFLNGSEKSSQNGFGSQNVFSKTRFISRILYILDLNPKPFSTKLYGEGDKYWYRFEDTNVMIECGFEIAEAHKETTNYYAVEKKNGNKWQVPYQMAKCNYEIWVKMSSCISKNITLPICFKNSDNPKVIIPDKHDQHLLRLYDLKFIMDVVFKGNIYDILGDYSARRFIIPISEYIYLDYEKRGIKIQKSAIKRLLRRFGFGCNRWSWSEEEMLYGVIEFSSYLIQKQSKKLCKK